MGFEYVTGIYLALKGLSDVHPDPVGVQVFENEKANSQIEKAINNIEMQEARKNEFPNNSTEVQTTDCVVSALQNEKTSTNGQSVVITAPGRDQCFDGQHQENPSA